MCGNITLCLSAAHNTASPICVCAPVAPRSSLSMRPSHRWRSSWLEVQRLEASRACSSLCSTSRLLRLSTEQRIRRASIFSCTCWASSSETTYISRNKVSQNIIYCRYWQYWKPIKVRGFELICQIQNKLLDRLSWFLKSIYLSNSNAIFLFTMCSEHYLKVLPSDLVLTSVFPLGQQIWFESLQQ